MQLYINSNLKSEYPYIENVQYVLDNCSVTLVNGSDRYMTSIDQLALMINNLRGKPFQLMAENSYCDIDSGSVSLNQMLTAHHNDVCKVKKENADMQTEYENKLKLKRAWEQHRIAIEDRPNKSRDVEVKKLDFNDQMRSKDSCLTILDKELKDRHDELDVLQDELKQSIWVEWNNNKNNNQSKLSDIIKAINTHNSLISDLDSEIKKISLSPLRIMSKANELVKLKNKRASTNNELKRLHAKEAKLVKLLDEPAQSSKRHSSIRSRSTLETLINSLKVSAEKNRKDIALIKSMRSLGYTSINWNWSMYPDPAKLIAAYDAYQKAKSELVRINAIKEPDVVEPEGPIIKEERDLPKCVLALSQLELKVDRSGWQNSLWYEMDLLPNLSKKSVVLPSLMFLGGTTLALIVWRCLWLAVVFNLYNPMPYLYTLNAMVCITLGINLYYLHNAIKHNIIDEYIESNFDHGVLETTSAVTQSLESSHLAKAEYVDTLPSAPEFNLPEADFLPENIIS